MTSYGNWANVGISPGILGDHGCGLYLALVMFHVSGTDTHFLSQDKGEWSTTREKGSDSLGSHVGRY